MRRLWRAPWWSVWARIVTRRCCSTARRGPHSRLCLSQYMTRRERLDAAMWTLRGWTPWWCRECGVRRPSHKMRCSHGGARQLILPATMIKENDDV